MVPRNRNLPYEGWRTHHIKTFSKIDPDETIIFEAGELPNDSKRQKTEKSEKEKKLSINEICINIRALLEKGQDEEAFQQYPKAFLQWGEKIKTLIKQKAQFNNDTNNPHLWVHGFPGTGKTAILKYLYPTYYKKDLNNRFFDLYDDKVHTHIMLEDMDPENVGKLGIQFLKTLCDEAGFPIDQKYKTPQLTRATVLVTSNFTIDAVVPEGKGVEETKMAMYRRFWQMRIDELYRLLGIKMIDKWERNKLKLAGNEAPGAIFISWNYENDCPTGVPLRSPIWYQQFLRNYYFSRI
nr:nonstructural protein [Flumine parvovirus 4]